MSKKIGTITLILSIIAVILSAGALYTASSGQQGEPAQDVQSETAETEEAEQAEQSDGDVQYVMYLGTNDKDTNEPVFSKEKAKEKAEAILVDFFGGYTIQEAYGGWKDGDTVYQEYSVVIYLSDTNLEDVHAAADKLIEEFHQSSVLIQQNKTVTEFYSGE